MVLTSFTTPETNNIIDASGEYEMDIGNLWWKWNMDIIGGNARRKHEMDIIGE
jgi:hypothetical protein